MNTLPYFEVGLISSIFCTAIISGICGYILTEFWKAAEAHFFLKFCIAVLNGFLGLLEILRIGTEVLMISLSKFNNACLDLGYS